MIAGSKVEGEDLLDPEFTQFGYTLLVPNVPPTGSYPELELCLKYKVCVSIICFENQCGDLCGKILLASVFLLEKN
jgi:hypothetical protein